MELSSLPRQDNRVISVSSGTAPPPTSTSPRETATLPDFVSLSYLQVLNSNSSHFCHLSSDPIRNIELLIWLTLEPPKSLPRAPMAIVGEVVHNPIQRKQHGPEVKET